LLGCVSYFLCLLFSSGGWISNGTYNHLLPWISGSTACDYLFVLLWISSRLICKCNSASYCWPSHNWHK
jgi:hypothetical protein